MDTRPGARSPQTALTVVGKLLALTLAAIVAGPAAATEGEEHEHRKERDWTIAPLVMSNPAFGDALGIAGMYFFDPSSRGEAPRSFVGGAGAYSNTDSYFAALGGRLFLRDDRLRVTGGLVSARVENDYETPFERNAVFSSEFQVVGARALWRVGPKLFLGGQIGVVHNSCTPADDFSRAYLELVGAEHGTSASFGAILSHDSRDSQFAATRGIFAEAQIQSCLEALGNEDDFHILMAEYNHYKLLQPKHVLAWRLYLQTGTDNTPFHRKASLGHRSDLRGFIAGEIRGRSMYAGQAEWRFSVHRRWGGVVFAGAAVLEDEKVLEELLGLEDVYYSGGIGVRFALMESQKLNFRVDYAWGNAGNDAFYVGIGEAF